MTNEEVIRSLEHIRSAIRNHIPPTKPGKAIEAVDLAIAALERDRWISVEERLPEVRQTTFHGEPCTESTPVLVYGGMKGMESYYNGMAVAERGDGEWIIMDDSYRPDNHVTHWMSLPEPPKEDKP